MKINGKWYIVRLADSEIFFGKVYMNDKSDWVEIKRASLLYNSEVNILNSGKNSKDAPFKLKLCLGGSIFLKVGDNALLLPSSNLYDSEGAIIE